MQNVQLFDEREPENPKEDYGNSDRLDPDEARDFIRNMVHHMQRRAHSLSRERSSLDRHSDDSVQKQYYGEQWTLFYGIQVGLNLMRGAERKEWDGEKSEWVSNGVSTDESWQEHYDEWGYGRYGRGLEIGKRLAFYEDRQFEFSDGEETESESNFTIRSYDD